MVDLHLYSFEVPEKEILKVSSTTNVAKLADAIFKLIVENKKIVIRCFGEFSIYQMTKALAKCKRRLDNKNMYLLWYSEWATVSGEKDAKKLSALITKVFYGYLSDDESDEEVEQSNNTVQINKNEVGV